MALPRHLKNGLTPLEIEFLAENELIEIEAAIDTRTDLELLSVSFVLVRLFCNNAKGGGG